MELWVIDAVVDDVAEGLRAVEDRDLILAKEVPTLVDEAVPYAVDPLDLVALRARARWLRCCQTRPRREQRHNDTGSKLSHSTHVRALGHHVRATAAQVAAG